MEHPRSVYSLSFHSPYRCRHSGACCTADWPIPIEADRLSRVRAAIASGALSTRHRADALFSKPAADDADNLVLLGTRDGSCVFFDPDHGRRCLIHLALGHDALPLACRQFPRVSLHDPRGVSVTLSHYCPTAAGLLERPGLSTILAESPAFPVGAEYSGLDATASLPPLLCPEVLMDWEAWWDFERLAVETLTQPGGSIEDALARLAAIVEDIRWWRPHVSSSAQGLPAEPTAETLRERVVRAFRDATAGQGWTPSDAWLAARVQMVEAAIPAGLADAAVGGETARKDGPSRPTALAFRRFLAAHAFANWTAHLGRGLRTWLTSVETAYTLVVSGLSFQSADLRLRHFADPRRLATECSRMESETQSD